MKTKILCSLTAALAAIPALAAPPPAPCGAVPSKQQVEWLRMEWYAFVHFSLNTYTNREWGYGDEKEELFNPKSFNANEIVKVFKEAGMKGMIYTAKHHDGWCSWPTKSTGHNITKSPWKKGKGDVVKAFSQACAQNGIKFGTYLSPWDRNCAEYGRPGYLRVYYKQIEELLSKYGPVFEIWFDGANGGDGYYGGAKEKRNIGSADKYYNFEQVVRNIRKLQPDCIIWGAGGHGDVTWGGSEKGFVKYPCWNTDMKDNSPKAKWMSLEADTTINHAGWFWHPGQEARVKTPEQLVQVYFDSVGRGANLILNVAPNRDGKLDPADVRALQSMADTRRRLLAKDYALGAKAKASEVRGKDETFGADKVTDGDIETYWCPNDGTTTGDIELQLDKPVTFDVVRVREQIRLGQRVQKFRLSAKVNGEWQVIDDAGQSIGNQVLRKLAEPVTSDCLKLEILEARACPCINEISLLKMPKQMPTPEISRKGDVLSISGNSDYEIHYSTDGSDPTADSPIFKEGNRYAGAGELKAAYVDKSDGSVGPVAMKDFGLCKVNWSSKAKEAVDDDPQTLWNCDSLKDASIEVDLGKPTKLNAFSYLPRQDAVFSNMTDRYKLYASADGQKWKLVSEGEFSNLRANPIEQKIGFDAITARYVRFVPERALEGNGASVAELNFYAAKGKSAKNAKKIKNTKKQKK